MGRKTKENPESMKKESESRYFVERAIENSKKSGKWDSIAFNAMSQIAPASQKAPARRAKTEE